MRVFLILLFIAACSDTSRDKVSRQEEEASHDIFSFETRLTNKLLVKGERCTGREVVVTEEGSRICDVNQFLITVDDENFCTPEGCTNVFVEPVIGTLIPRGNDELISFYEIVPFLSDNQTQDTLEGLVLRTRENEVPQVIFDRL